MITDVPHRDDDRLTWNDLEMLPVYGAALLLGWLFVSNLSQLGPALHAETVKAALVCGIVAVHRLLSADDGASD